MIWQYSHVFETAQYWLDATAFDERLKSKELHRMAQDLRAPKSEVAQHGPAIRYDREFVRMGFRTVASDTNERTLIFSLLPKHCGSGNSMFVNTPKYYSLGADGQVKVQAVSALRLLFGLAWFNSVPVDWIARQMIQINVNKTYLYRLPMPQPSDDEIRSSPKTHCYSLWRHLRPTRGMTSASWRRCLACKGPTHPTPPKPRTPCVQKMTSWWPVSMASPTPSWPTCCKASRSWPTSGPSTWHC